MFVKNFWTVLKKFHIINSIGLGFYLIMLQIAKISAI